MALLPCPRCCDARGPRELGCEQRLGREERGLRPHLCCPAWPLCGPDVQGPRACFPSGSTGLGHVGLGAPGAATAFPRATPLLTPGQALDTDHAPHPDPWACRLPGAAPGWDPHLWPFRPLPGHRVESVCRLPAGPTLGLVGSKAGLVPYGYEEWPDLQETDPTRSGCEREVSLWTDWPKPGPRAARSGHRPLPAGGPAPPRPGLRQGAGRAGPWEWGAAEGQGACRVLLWLVRLRGRGWGLGVPAHPG